MKDLFIVLMLLIAFPIYGDDTHQKSDNYAYGHNTKSGTDVSFGHDPRSGTYVSYGNDPRSVAYTSYGNDPRNDPRSVAYTSYGNDPRDQKSNGHVSYGKDPRYGNDPRFGHDPRYGYDPRSGFYAPYGNDPRNDPRSVAYTSYGNDPRSGAHVTYESPFAYASEHNSRSGSYTFGQGPIAYESGQGDDTEIDQAEPMYECDNLPVPLTDVPEDNQTFVFASGTGDKVETFTDSGYDGGMNFASAVVSSQSAVVFGDTSEILVDQTETISEHQSEIQQLREKIKRPNEMLETQNAETNDSNQAVNVYASGEGDKVETFTDSVSDGNRVSVGAKVSSQSSSISTDVQEDTGEGINDYYLGGLIILVIIIFLLFLSPIIKNCILLFFKIKYRTNLKPKP